MTLVHKQRVLSTVCAYTGCTRVRAEQVMRVRARAEQVMLKEGESMCNAGHLCMLSGCARAVQLLLKCKVPLEEQPLVVSCSAGHWHSQ